MHLAADAGVARHMEQKLRFGAVVWVLLPVYVPKDRCRAEQGGAAPPRPMRGQVPDAGQVVISWAPRSGLHGEKRLVIQVVLPASVRITCVFTRSHCVATAGPCWRRR